MSKKTALVVLTIFVIVSITALTASSSIAAPLRTTCNFHIGSLASVDYLASSSNLQEAYGASDSVSASWLANTYPPNATVIYNLDYPVTLEASTTWEGWFTSPEWVVIHLIDSNGDPIQIFNQTGGGSHHSATIAYQGRVIEQIVFYTNSYATFYLDAFLLPGNCLAPTSTPTSTPTNTPTITPTPYRQWATPLPPLPVCTSSVSTSTPTPGGILARTKIPTVILPTSSAYSVYTGEGCFASDNPNVNTCQYQSTCKQIRYMCFDTIGNRWPVDVFVSSTITNAMTFDTGGEFVFGTPVYNGGELLKDRKYAVVPSNEIANSGGPTPLVPCARGTDVVQLQWENGSGPINGQTAYIYTGPEFYSTQYPGTPGAIDKVAYYSPPVSVHGCTTTTIPASACRAITDTVYSPTNPRPPLVWVEPPIVTECSITTTYELMPGMTITVPETLPFFDTFSLSIPTVNICLRYVTYGGEIFGYNLVWLISLIAAIAAGALVVATIRKQG